MEEKEAKRAGAGGWPLVPSVAWPGELTLSCPNCGSQAVTQTVSYPAVGTGRGGVGRLGDSGTRNLLICGGCRHRTTY